MRVHVYDNDLKKETYCFDVVLPEPVNFVFTKDRITKQRYLMEKNNNGQMFLHPCNYSQYDNVELRLEK